MKAALLRYKVKSPEYGLGREISLADAAAEMALVEFSAEVGMAAADQAISLAGKMYAAFAGKMYAAFASGAESEAELPDLTSLRFELWNGDAERISGHRLPMGTSDLDGAIAALLREMRAAAAAYERERPA